MNLRHYLLTLLLMTGIALSAASEQLVFDEDNPLLFGMDMDYAPLEYVDDSGLPYGVDVEYTKELMRRLGFSFVFKPNTWANIKDDVMEGRVDLGMMVYSPYRTNVLSYSRAVLRLYYQIVCRKQDNSRFDLRNLAGKEIAYMASRPVTDTLTRVGALLQVVTDLPQAMKELNDGKYDAVICFRYQAEYFINRFRLKNLKAYDLTLTPREYCYVSRNKQLIDRINVILEQMENDGTHEKLYGNISTKVGRFEMPQWVWYTLAAVVLIAMLMILLLQRRHTLRIQLEMERAKRSERSKTVFLGNVSHALRTPLNAIIGFSDVLKDDKEGLLSREEQLQFYEQINKNGRQLLYFINELLQLSNIESSQRKFHPAECDLGKLLGQCEEEVKPFVKPGVRLLIEKTSMVMTFDADLAHIVVNHLLSNAALHTKQGSIELKYHRQDGGVYLEVKDTGEGLPESIKDNIFQLLSDQNTFIQSETPGLGLSICRAIVDMCHGKMGVRSEVGSGCTFWVWVPKNYWNIRK
jgi:signal transduction histidine kinase